MPRVVQHRILEFEQNNSAGIQFNIARNGNDLCQATQAFVITKAFPQSLLGLFVISSSSIQSSLHPQMLKLAVLPSLNGQADERISYYDEGGKDSTKGTVLLLHDILNPDFLYHKVVIRFAELGYRIIAPTLSDQDNLGLAVDKSFAQVQLVLNLLSSLDITGPVKINWTWQCWW